MRGALSNPFIRLRHGQLLFETGDFVRAKQELLVAYATEGADIFAEDHPTYLAYISDMLSPMDKGSIPVARDSLEEPHP